MPGTEPIKLLSERMEAFNGEAKKKRMMTKETAYDQKSMARGTFSERCVSTLSSFHIINLF